MDFNTGSVFFEIELLLSSDSGRDKHVDPIEQGGWLTYPIRQALTSVETPGMGYGRIRYFGERCRPTGEAYLEEDVGQYRETVHEANVRRLRLLVQALGHALDDVAADPPEALSQVVDWASGRRPIEDLDFELRRALSDGDD